MVHLKFGVVGAGHIGKRHMEMIRRNPAFQLTAFADIRSRSECGVDETVPHYDSIERMLDAHEELDVVCICTPNGFHAEQSILAIKSDCHVVIEKPMALNRQDGEDILHTALSRGKQGVLCNAKPVFTALNLAQGFDQLRRIGQDSHGTGPMLLESGRPLLW
jgi:predicted dehydrogenase